MSTYKETHQQALHGLENISMLEAQLQKAGAFEVKDKALALLRQQKRQFALLLKGAEDLDQRLTKLESGANV